MTDGPESYDEYVAQFNARQAQPMTPEAFAERQQRDADRATRIASLPVASDARALSWRSKEVCDAPAAHKGQEVNCELPVGHAGLHVYVDAYPFYDSVDLTFLYWAVEADTNG